MNTVKRCVATLAVMAVAALPMSVAHARVLEGDGAPAVTRTADSACSSNS